MVGWGVTNLRDPIIGFTQSTVSLDVDPNDVIDSSDAIFWIAPSSYRGNKVSTSAAAALLVYHQLTVPDSGSMQLFGEKDNRNKRQLSQYHVVVIHWINQSSLLAEKTHS